jgi:microcystin-dependent protein
MATGTQGVPQWSTPLVGSNGQSSQPWYLFFVTLWSLVNSAVVTGEIKVFSGPSSAVPSGYLLCDGTAYSRVTHATLFATIGTVWGAGNTVTTFNVPNLVDKVLVGVGTHALGTTTGVTTGTGAQVLPSVAAVNYIIKT